MKITPREESAFLAWGDFHARSRFARSTIPEEKLVLLVVYSNLCSISLLAPWYYRFLITAILSGVIGIIIFLHSLQVLHNKKAKTALIRPAHSSSTQALIIDLRWINFRIPCGAFIGLSIFLNALMVF